VRERRSCVKLIVRCGWLWCRELVYDAGHRARAARFGGSDRSNRSSSRSPLNWPDLHIQAKIKKQFRVGEHSGQCETVIAATA
jgi:hypothetical protein